MSALATGAQHDQLGLFDSWTCHARPAALGGRPCGHFNAGGTRRRFENRVLDYCEACGCTRKASEDRERKVRQ